MSTEKLHDSFSCLENELEDIESRAWNAQRAAEQFRDAINEALAVAWSEGVKAEREKVHCSLGMEPKNPYA